MNLNKLDLMLCLAFQESEGPFNVRIKFINPLEDKLEYLSLSKQEIKNISLWDEVDYISIYIPFKERRWRKRTR